MTTPIDWIAPVEALSWALTHRDAVPASAGAPLEELDAIQPDPEEIGHHVQQLLGALECHAAAVALTPNGLSWLDVHRVPVHRLLIHVVRKLLRLSAWPPFAAAPGPLTGPPDQAFLGERDSGTREYRSYTVTWPGIAYLLGGPDAAGQPFPPSPRISGEHGANGPASVVALSWSSRHAETLLPVLHDVSHRQQRSLLLDLATDPAQRCPSIEDPRIDVRPVPPDLLNVSGGLPSPLDSGRSIRIGVHTVLLDRLIGLISRLLEHTAGSTQLSWQATVRAEMWLEDVLDAARPTSVLVSNDVSPLGVLATRTADRMDIRTVYVQHGARIPGSTGTPGLHARHVVVMGNRDSVWASHHDAEVHVLGQPRFDALTRESHSRHRAYLDQLFASHHGTPPERFLVWACQPFALDRLNAQAELLFEAMRAARGDWALVIAPHPALAPQVFTPMLESAHRLKVAVADHEVGARGCLAGADALVSVSSTCGIEAMLLGVPIIELHLPGERTLDLAAHEAARACTNANEVAHALSELGEASRRPRLTATAMDSICRWDGTAAAAVAQLALALP
ncbi:hypothetical protein AB0I81_20315 [Nonomuraea sp. NPDC050404]|uniref:hypothetical protein n=1 Tax=Nonomuraea sp. NPDC050404 TaxID=3155783 RepID=UPI0033DD10CD